MSISTLILGPSGSGKSASMRNLDPANTLLIQSVPKPLPFRSSAWKKFHKETAKDGNVFTTDHWESIIQLATKTGRKIVVVDDFQYVLANEFMRRHDEKNYDKFTDIGFHAWEIISKLNALPDDKRIYFLSHTDEDQFGKIKMKTIGKMLDDKITLEGLFTIVLRAERADGEYVFRTQSNGSDTCKSPMGMFDSEKIENDIAAVDAAITEYYGYEA